MMVKKIEISHRTVIFTVFFLLLLWLLYQIRHILVGLFIAVVLMAAINPAVDRMERMKIPRLLGIFLVYLLILVGFGLLVAGVIPPLIEQTTAFIARLPEDIEHLGLPLVGERVLDSQIDHLGSIPASLVRVSVSVFTNLISVIAILVITFYLLLERKNLNRYLHLLFGDAKEKQAEALINQIERQLGGWVRAELVLMAIIGALSYLGLRLLGIDFALPLALLAGVLEVVPNIGPIVSAIPAVLAGLVISPLMGLAAAALYFLIQQLENSIIVPQVMAKGVGVNPLITIIALAIGFQLGGILGAVLSVPLVLLLRILATEVFSAERFKHL